MDLTHKEISARGGRSNVKKYGLQKYSDMGKKGAVGKVAKYGKDYYLKLAIKGLEGRLAKGNIDRETFLKAEAKLKHKIDRIDLPE